MRYWQSDLQVYLWTKGIVRYAIETVFGRSLLYNNDQADQ